MQTDHGSHFLSPTIISIISIMTLIIIANYSLHWVKFSYFENRQWAVENVCSRRLAHIDRDRTEWGYFTLYFTWGCLTLRQKQYRVWFTVQQNTLTFTLHKVKYTRVNMNTCSQEIEVADNELFKYAHVTFLLTNKNSRFGHVTLVSSNEKATSRVN